MTRVPAGLLFDYGGTLVQEAGWDAHAGLSALMSHAVEAPTGADLERISLRAELISADVAARRDQFGIEVPWPSLARLIHDFSGTRFTVPLADLEIVFWDASVKTLPMPGVRDALGELRRLGIPMGVVSNTAFRSEIIRHELAKHGLDEFLAIIVLSSEYGVRKPNTLLFELAAARLGLSPQDIWFVGDRLDMDVAGAKAAGMTSVLYSSGTVDRGAADHVVRTWSELLGIVRSTQPEATSGKSPEKRYPS